MDESRTGLRACEVTQAIFYGKCFQGFPRCSMKVSAALQILTTVMSGTTSTDDWSLAGQQHVQQANDFIPRAELDLGACLDIETGDDFSQNMYIDSPSAPTTHVQNAWVDNVIDMTSSGEHGAGIVPNSAEVSDGGLLTVSQQSLSDAHFDFTFMDNLTGTDNATFMSMETLTSAATAMDTSLVEESVQDFAQFGSLSSAALTSTTTTSTIDLTALGSFVALDSVDATPKNTLEDFGILGGSSNIPNTLWNLDLTLPVVEEAPSTSAAQDIQDVKASLKNRLYSRGSANSVSQDSDVINTYSLRSPASSTSSLTQSFEDEESDDPVKALEKREKNRLAAQKCRGKKRDKADNLQKNVARLEDRQERLKEEVGKLRDELEVLEGIISIHGVVCPKMRKLSSISDS
ncbi:hypothetical protein ACOMHN_026554 [Nucella lapillus]